MSQAEPIEAKPYHHGDLRCALVRAAVSVLEREGPSALSLRAVAREAGVSPAAPYHHFKDKAELLSAVAADGLERLKQALTEAFAAAGPAEARSAMGVAYVAFSRANPALYRVMWDTARNRGRLPGTGEDGGGELDFLRGYLGEVAGDRLSETDVQLNSIASWCAAHGLAEIGSFAQFEPLKQALGGERAFVRAVLEHLGGLGSKRR
jgi:AcrR family transcriptional regulator